MMLAGQDWVCQYITSSVYDMYILEVWMEISLKFLNYFDEKWQYGNDVHYFYFNDNDLLELPTYSTSGPVKDL